MYTNIYRCTPNTCIWPLERGRTRRTTCWLSTSQVRALCSHILQHALLRFYQAFDIKKDYNQRHGIPMAIENQVT